MESKNRNTWILVAVVVIFVGCCGLVVLAGGAMGWIASQARQVAWGPEILGGNHNQRIERTFEVGGEPFLDVTNFAGAITVRSGEEDVIQVLAMKHARREGDLGQVDVAMSERGDGLLIRTKTLRNLKNASVDLEIKVPAGTRLELHTGAGRVQVRNVAGSVTIYSGAGNIDLQGTTGTVRLGVGAGEIRYEGTPAGQCSFETGAGEITLRFPSDVSVEVDLGTGLGGVDVEFPVDGRVTSREVRGVIGDGGQGSVYAHTGVGSIHVGR
ncbi:MAG: DUF4097 family beta strand repeat-containing protein [Anaerolineae bacterium]